MKVMQHPDMLSLHSGSREVLWLGGSKILSVGSCFSATELLCIRVQCFCLVWKVKGTSY